LHIKQEWGMFNRNAKERSEAVMRAAAIFMDITFNQRIEGYERELESKGFVTWGDYQIARDGDVFRKNELRFNIKKGEASFNLGPFHIECHKRNPRIADKLKGLWTSTAE